MSTAVAEDTRTDRQRAVFEYLFESTRSRGYQPTLRDIAEAVGGRSPSGIVPHLIALHKKGWITYEPSGRGGAAPRSIVILRRPDGSKFEGFR